MISPNSGYSMGYPLPRWKPFTSINIRIESPFPMMMLILDINYDGDTCIHSSISKWIVGIFHRFSQGFPWFSLGFSRAFPISKRCRQASPIKLLLAGAQCAPLSLKLRRSALRTHRPAGVNSNGGNSNMGLSSSSCE